MNATVRTHSEEDEPNKTINYNRSHDEKEHRRREFRLEQGTNWLTWSPLNETQFPQLTLDGSGPQGKVKLTCLEIK